MIKLSYVVTSYAPFSVDLRFKQIKEQFNLYIQQEVSSPDHVIAKNHAHITLKSSFHLKEDFEERHIITALSSISFTPIAIEATKLTVFQTPHHGNVLVALVDKTPELQQFHNAIYLALEEMLIAKQTFERQSFTPHVSLLYRLPEDDVGAATAYAEEHILPISYTLREFSLLREVKDVKHLRSRVKHFTTAREQK